jgi:hypothetical protein
MANYVLVPVDAEDYEAAGIGADSVIESYVQEDGALVIRTLDPDDLDNFTCDGKCCECPISGLGCGSDCFSCPCLCDRYLCRCGGRRVLRARKERRQK